MLECLLKDNGSLFLCLCVVVQPFLFKGLLIPFASASTSIPLRSSLVQDRCESRSFFREDFPLVCSVLNLSSLEIAPSIYTVEGSSSIQARQVKATVTEGQDFRFEWDFSVQPSDKKIKKIVFGIWGVGFLESYLVTVKSNSKVIESPELVDKNPEYVGRVKWAGDISSSYAAFVLESVKSTDSKIYGCEVNLGFFEDTLSSQISLTVQPASNTSSFIQVPPSRITSSKDREAVFKWKYRVSATEKKLHTSLEWGKYNNRSFRALYSVDGNGVIIKDPHYTTRVTANKTDHFGNIRFHLFLSNLTVMDEGTYGLKVAFGKSKILENEVILDVHEPPQITVSPSVPAPLPVGKSLVLLCIAKGKPSPQLKWIKDGRVLLTEFPKRSESTQSVYHVQQLTKSDAGYYSCFASNSVGNTSSPRVHVQIQYPPIMVLSTKAQTVLSWKGHRTRLKCLADAYPSPQYFWRRSGRKILSPATSGDANGSALTVTPSLDSDFTNYTCVATNAMGQDSVTFTLKPVGPPDPPVITSIEVSRNSFKLIWQEPSSKQDTPITGHVIKLKEKGQHIGKWKEIDFKAKSNYFTVKNLTKATYYRIKMFASNVVGYSNSSTVKEIKTLLEGPPDPPKVHLNNTVISSPLCVTWDDPDNDGGAAIHLFTIWYRVVDGNRTKGVWRTVNVTECPYWLSLNRTLVYEIMVTAWNKNGQSFVDPDNAARVTVLKERLGNNANVDDDQNFKYGDIHRERGTEPKDALTYLPIISVVAFPLIVILLWKLRTRHNYWKNAKANDKENCENVEDEPESLPEPQIRIWEFAQEHLVIERVIGDGAFGVVSKAYALNLPGIKGWTTVAVKSPRANTTEIEKRDLLSELNLLKKLKPHPHIIKLLGCVTTTDSPIVIIEYVPYGDLLGYLRRSRGINDCYYDDPDNKPATNLTSHQLLKFAWQISDGMRYISSKKIIHRDLAARNVLVGENQRCKITDFGMARDVKLESIYVPRSEGRIPVKWTAIEAMTGQPNYSVKSDVWSFGVVLFEICTIGAEPYPGIIPWKIPDVVRKGYRNPKPTYVKDELYAIMTECWKTEPEERPTFDCLCGSIRALERHGNQNYVNVQDCLEAHENDIAESIA